MIADQVSHLSHLHARDTTLVYASRAPQAHRASETAHGLDDPVVYHHRRFDATSGLTNGTGTTSSSATATRSSARTSSTTAAMRRWAALGATWTSRRWTAGELGRFARRLSAVRPYKWWSWHDTYDAEPSPNPKWVQVTTIGEAAFRKPAE